MGAAWREGWETVASTWLIRPLSSLLKAVSGVSGRLAYKLADICFLLSPYLA